MVIHHLQPSFSGGEVSPSLYSRVDTAAYTTWLKTACNFFVHPQGGVSNRAGTLFMGQAKSAPCRLVPFAVSEEEAYVLEMGAQYIRFFTSSGQVLDDEGDPYELLAPYAAAEIASVNYTQHEQVLFLTHPQHPPMRLRRVAAGRFVLEEVPLKYGPFQPANTVETQKLRVVVSQETVESSGVSATLAFTPLSDGRYIVMAYFNDTLFNVGPGYGLQLDAIVSSFNDTYGSQGLQAYNLGGMLKIVSPQATGGDWNGAELKLTYRDSFAHDPQVVLTQTLSGGSNAGEAEPGEEQYMLESNFDLFAPGHVGGRFRLTHPLDSQYQTGSLGTSSSSAIVKTGSDWRLRTFGSWTGTLVVEYSADLGATWRSCKHFSRASSDEDNITALGNLEDDGSLFYVRVRSQDVSGTVEYELSCSACVQHGICVVEEFVSARKVWVRMERGVASDEWTDNWAEGSFCPKNGYPACVFFYQDRCGFAGTAREPQTVWFSKTAEHANFGHARTTLADSDSISINLSGRTLNAIRAVIVAGRLLVFTAGSEWSISADGALTPYNMRVEQQGERGAAHTPPLLVGNQALFVQARGSVLRNFYYDYTSASYTGEDLTLTVRHLFANQQISALCYQQEPDTLVWCVLSDGTLATLTYMPEQQICAWTHQTTQGKFRSVCTIPCRGYDEVWFAVERGNHYFIEKLARRLVSTQPQDQVFLDASISKKSETAFCEIDGLDHLEGCQVRVLADGSPCGDFVVSDGAITLPHEVNCVHVGLSYQAVLHFLPVGISSAQETAVDRSRRVVSILLKLADSRGGYVGLEGETLEEIIQRSGEAYNTPLPLKTADYLLTLSGSHQRAPSVVFEQREPLPVSILALVRRIV